MPSRTHINAKYVLCVYFCGNVSFETLHATSFDICSNNSLERKQPIDIARMTSDLLGNVHKISLLLCACVSVVTSSSTDLYSPSNNSDTYVETKQ